MLKSRSLARYVPMIAVMGTLFFLSHLPGDVDVVHLEEGVDKLVHGAAYGLLTITVIFGLSCPKRCFSFRTVVMVLIICLGYGMLDEWHQSFVPGRDASVLDLLADGVGSILAVTVWLSRARRDIRIRESGDRRRNFEAKAVTAHSMRFRR